MAAQTTSAAATSAGDLITSADRYSRNLPPRPAPLRPRAPAAKDVVLVTGTTGNFGTDILECLLRDDAIERVYAVNRKGTHALDRQTAAFRARDFDEALFHSPKLKMVEADLAIPGLGIDPSLLEEIRTCVTYIIHNAWNANFNLPLSSFDVFLEGLRHLVDLALSSPFSEPPKIQFVSSVAVFQRCTESSRPLPEDPVDPSWALGTGYSESKWVAETFLLSVAQQTELPVQIVRLGQLSGSDDGYWNKGEWFPTIVKSALATRGGLPDMHGVAAFIPNAAAARALIEMRAASPIFMHIVHPRPARLHALFACVAEQLSLALLPYEKWIADLTHTAQSIASAASHGEHVQILRKNPALLLLGFFSTRRYTQEGEILPFVELSTEHARAASETLEYLPEMSEDALVGRWLAAWRAAGILATN